MLIQNLYILDPIWYKVLWIFQFVILLTTRSNFIMHHPLCQVLFVFPLRGILWPQCAKINLIYVCSNLVSWFFESFKTYNPFGSWWKPLNGNFQLLEVKHHLFQHFGTTFDKWKCVHEIKVCLVWLWACFQIFKHHFICLRIVSPTWIKSNHIKLTYMYKK